MKQTLPDSCLDQLFRKARTYNGWTDRAVDNQLLSQLYELLRLGPTSANTCPARFVWVRSSEGKARLSNLSSENNKAKILAAPCTVIVGYDLDFANWMPKLFPARGEMMKTEDVLEILSIPLLGIVPESVDVLNASNLGSPITLNNPNSGAAKAYFDAARRLRGEQFEVVVPAERVGLMGRLFGRRALA